MLYGLGGSGKTQICLKYLQDQRERYAKDYDKTNIRLLNNKWCRYWGIFWIDASTEQSVQQSFTQVARVFQVEENVDSVKRRLAHTSDSWLLVFDNADDPNLRLTPYLPTGNRGDIIITSRNPQCQQYHTVGCQRAGQLSLDDALIILGKVIYGTATPWQNDSAEESKTIAETLGCLALALVQAGAYIRETSCSLREYLDLYERRKRLVLRYLPQHVATDYQYSVYTTWQVSVDMIESRQDTASHHALRLLNLLGFYHYDQIPVELFYNAWDASQRSSVIDHLPWSDTTLDYFDYQQAVQTSITVLASFSLVTRNTNTSVFLHPLVHNWCRDRISADEERQLSYRRAVALLVSSVRWEFTSEDYAFRRSLVSHVHELLRLRDQLNNVSEEEKMRQWPILALILAESGWTRDALRLTEEVVALRKSKLGPDHPDTLTLMHNLAIWYSEAGRRAEALSLMEEVVEGRRLKLGDDHPDTLLSAKLLTRLS